MTPNDRPDRPDRMEVGGGTCRCYKVDDEEDQEDQEDQDYSAGDVIESLRLVFGTRTAGRNLTSALIVGKDLVQLHLLLGGDVEVGVEVWSELEPEPG